ncbi:MAG: signal recognition particle receptor subunit alpha, partial [Sediminispirochaetaceae bacterium]
MAKKGLGAALRTLFARGGITEEVLEELEDLLIEGDINARTAMEIVEEVEKQADAKENALSRIREMLYEDIITEELTIDPDKLNLFLMLGVNGVGKTTSLAKMSRYYADQQQASSIMVAADTFRAAAIDQLEEHGRRLNVRVVRQNPGADPGAVVYDGIESAKNNSVPLVLVDTAGRMHTKANLV